MPVWAYRGVPLCQQHFYAFWSGVYMGVVSGGSSRCRPCSWKVRRWGTHPGPCAIGSSWRAVVASLEYVTAGWLRLRRLTMASVGAGRGRGGLCPRSLHRQGGGLGLETFCRLVGAWVGAAGGGLGSTPGGAPKCIWCLCGSCSLW